MSLKQDELCLLKPHKHGESLFGLLLNPRPHECLIQNSIPHVRQPMVTLFPPTLRRRTSKATGVVAVELSPWKAPENAASTLHGLVSAIGAPAQRESRESSSLRHLLSCDCAALQEHGARN